MVTVRTLAKTLDAPFCQTLTVPERSTQKSLPSGANDKAVAKLPAMVPCGAGSLDGATHASAVAEGVTVGGNNVGVATGVTLADGRGVDPQAAASTATPAIASRRRILVDRSADSGARLLVGHDDGAEVFACPRTDRIDHPLEVDTRRSEFVGGAWRHL